MHQLVNKQNFDNYTSRYMETQPGYIYIYIYMYVYGSVHRESNLITVKQDAAYSVYYISAGSSTCFGC